MTIGFQATKREQSAHNRHGLPRKARSSLSNAKESLAFGLLLVALGILSLILKFQEYGAVAILLFVVGIFMLLASASFFAEYRRLALRAGKRVITLRGRRGSKLRSSL